MTAAADPVRAIADAVLYEGYVLWPYRRSALKNAQRWTFGCVFPRAYGEEPWTMQTQCLVEGAASARVSVGVRFLHVVRRQVLDARGRAVDDAVVDGERHLTWDEAVEHEVAPGAATLAQLRSSPIAAAAAAGREHEPRRGGGARIPIAVAAGAERESLRGGGALVRSWERLDGRVDVRAERLAPALHRLTVRIENRTAWPGGPREDALRRAFCSTHTVLHVSGGSAFVSLTDPPARLRAAAAACANEGTWPVLVGEEGARDRLLSSPIILSDYPQVAPESAGDLFDGGEIDELLILNLLALTDAEKAEVRASDPRTRALLDRTEALSREQLMRLHGRTGIA